MNLITVGHLKLGSSSKVSLSLFHAFGICGRQTLEKVFLSKAEREMYSCVGSSFKLERVSGTVPLETKKVVKPRL